MLIQPPPVEGEEIAGLDVEQPDWLAIAEEAYESSTDYLDQNYRKQWEKNVANFRSRHPDGSKYYSDAYRNRTKLFRPKTRISMRKAEAMFAQAMFATSDVITVDPVDQADKEEDKRAEVWQAVLNHRLKYTIPWFLTAIGAFQEAKIYGIVCSRQDWEYEESYQEQLFVDPETGEEISQRIKTVTKNQPRCELIEIENIRFDPAAKWTDPVNTSPYFIELMPMYVGDVLAMMEAEDPKTGRPVWEKLTRGEILSYGRESQEKNDTTRMAREGNKDDPKDEDHRVKEFEIVWVHRNFVKKDGIDYEYYTLTTRKLLSEPVPTPSVIGRPYRIGICSPEAHRCIPAGEVELNQDLQAEANDISNQRRDNVKLALNKGYFVGRNQDTDLLTLKRSYPGRLVLSNDINSIREEIHSDVTGSSYHEQDRVNADMDDLLGGFSGGSVMTNRKLGETVGGMNLVNMAGSAVLEYSVRVFVETWVEPVLGDIIKLIQVYEDDALINRYAQSIGTVVENRQQFANELTASASVGFGTLDSKMRSQVIFQTLTALSKAVPWAMQGLDVKRLAKELFGPIGYRDGSKFFANLPDGPPQPKENPIAKAKQEEIAIHGQIEMAKLEQLKEFKALELRQEMEIKVLELAIKNGMTREQFFAKLDLDMDKLNLQIMQELGRRKDIQSRQDEMELKTIMGQGI